MRDLDDIYNQHLISYLINESINPLPYLVKLLIREFDTALPSWILS